MTLSKFLTIGKAVGLGSFVTFLGFTILYFMGVLLFHESEWSELFNWFLLWSVVIALPVYFSRIFKR